MSAPEILVIGSGAVGAVFAAHLEAAGCNVTFLVRDPDGPNARMPRRLHHYRPGRSTVTTTQNLPCVTSAGGRWDQAWLCLPSTALETDWLAQRLAELDTRTPLVSWTPDVRDRERLEARYQGPIVPGLIGFLAYQSPLPGTDLDADGFGYLLPPLASAMLERSDEGRRAAGWLRKGGLPTRMVADLPWTAARGAAVLITTVAALELSEWSFSGLRKSEHFRLGQQAAQEAIQATAVARGHGPGIARRLPLGLMLRGFLALAPVFSPVPLEAYFRFHFIKVGDQTRMMLDSWRSLAREQGCDTPALDALREALGEAVVQ